MDFNVSIKMIMTLRDMSSESGFLVVINS